jgi:hypothetical protein
VSFLDLYQQDARDATAMQPGEKTQLPATFSEGFEAAWNEGRLFRQSVSGETARQQALQDHIDDVRRRTGHDLAKDIDYSGSAEGYALTADMLREQVNAAARKVGQPELDAGALDQAAIAKSRVAQADYASMAGREKTGGGTAGFVLGSLAGAVTDPINVLALPVAPAEGLGILATGLRWAAIGGVSQAAIEVAGQDFREKVQPGYLESGEPLLNIAEAAGGAAVIGGGLRAAGNAWTRVKTGQWPRSIRDAGNIVDSEANVLQTNRFPGVEGEAAHHTALQDAIDRLVGGEPIEPDQKLGASVLASYDQKLEPILDALSRSHETRNLAEMERARASAEPTPELPFERTARMAEADQAVESIATELEKLAQSVGYDASYESADLAARISKMSQADALPVLDEFLLRPRTLADTLPSVTAAAKERRALAKALPEPMPPELAQELTPKALEDLRADPELDESILRDLDRLRAEKGDVEIPMGEQINAAGERVAVSRKIESVLAEADDRLAAAREIAACVGPQPEAGP